MSSPSPERAVAILSVAAFGSSASLRCTDALLPLLAGEFGTTVGTASSAITAFSVAYGLLQLVHGPIGDKVGKYRLAFITTLISLFGTIACAVAPTLEFLVIARFAAGATIGAIIPLAMAWIGDVVPYANRQSVLARFLIGQMLGVAGGAALGGYLGEHFGWRSPFYLLTVFYVVVNALLWLELRRNPYTQESSKAAPGSIFAGFGRMGLLLRDRWVRTILMTAIAEGALFYGALSFVALHLYRTLGLGLGASGTAIGAYALGGMLYVSVSKHLIRRLGERGLALTGGLTISAGFLGLVASSSMPASLACMFIVGAGIYSLHNTIQVNATQMAPQARGGALALFAFSLFCGQSLGVWVGGRIIDAAGTTPLFVGSAILMPILALEFRRRLAHRARLPAHT